jgi:HAE1 family hydrophobic/amphiphilic exporter-1
MRINGRPGVRMRVTKQSGKNTVAIAAAARREATRINREVPGVSLTVLRDQSQFIERSIAAVREATMYGAVLVVLVLFVFLRDFRSTLIICTSIPISVVGTFALLYFAGFTLNVMTFGGLALGIGMIVDSSIVVLENTFRHMEKGKSRRQAAIDGSEEVWSAILASTLTAVAVFVPLLFLSGISSVLFRQLSIVVIFSLTMALFVAVTVVPVLCSQWLRVPVAGGQRKGLSGRLFTASELSFQRVDDFYRRLLHGALFHRPTVVGAAAVLTFFAFLAVPLIPSELMPATDEGELRVTGRMPPGSRIERTDAVSARLEEMVRAGVPEATRIVASSSARGYFSGGGATANLEVKLVPKQERARSTEQIAEDLRGVLVGLPGVEITTRASGDNHMMSRLMGGQDAGRIAIEIRGYELDDAKRVGDDVLAVLQVTPGIANPRIGRDEGRPELAIRVDRPKAAMLGLSVSSVADTIRTNVGGTQAAFYRERGKEYPIVVRLRPEDRDRIESVDDVLISTPSGQVLPAKNLLAVDAQTGPTQIERKNQERIFTVNAELTAGTPLGEAVDDLQARLPAIVLPQGFSVGFGSEVEAQAEAFGQLRWLLVLGVLLVYAVMASQYESFRDPFIVMFSVPVAAIGVVAALGLTATSFSLQAYIGVILLAGIVVNNAILLVDYTNILRRDHGQTLRDAVELAGRTRLRPILMTTLTTILGLMPLAIGFGEGSELQAPLARVVIGGLAASTLVTLVLVPAMYTVFEEGVSGLRRGMTRPGPERA